MSRELGFVYIYFYLHPLSMTSFIFHQNWLKFAALWKLTGLESTRSNLSVGRNLQHDRNHGRREIFMIMSDSISQIRRLCYFYHIPHCTLKGHGHGLGQIPLSVFIVNNVFLMIKLRKCLPNPPHLGYLNDLCISSNVIEPDIWRCVQVHVQ